MGNREGDQDMSSALPGSAPCTSRTLRRAWDRSLIKAGGSASCARPGPSTRPTAGRSPIGHSLTRSGKQPRFKENRSSPVTGIGVPSPNLAPLSRLKRAVFSRPKCSVGSGVGRRDISPLRSGWAGSNQCLAGTSPQDRPPDPRARRRFPDRSLIGVRATDRRGVSTNHSGRACQLVWQPTTSLSPLTESGIQLQTPTFDRARSRARTYASERDFRAHPDAPPTKNPVPKRASCEICAPAPNDTKEILADEIHV